MNPWQQRNYDAGLCTCCGKRPRVKSLCVKCRERKNTAARARYAYNGRKTDRIYGATFAFIKSVAVKKGEITWHDLCPPLTRDHAAANLTGMLRLGHLQRTCKGRAYRNSTSPAKYKLKP